MIRGQPAGAASLKVLHGWHGPGASRTAPERRPTSRLTSFGNAARCVPGRAHHQGSSATGHKAPHPPLPFGGLLTRAVAAPARFNETCCRYGGGRDSRERFDEGCGRSECPIRPQNDHNSRTASVSPEDRRDSDHNSRPNRRSSLQVRVSDAVLAVGLRENLVGDFRPDGGPGRSMRR